MAKKIIPPRRGEELTPDGRPTVRFSEYLESNARQTNESTDATEGDPSSIIPSSAITSQINKKITELFNESLISQSGLIAKLNKRIEQLENTIISNQNNSKKFAQLENDFVAPFYKLKYDKLTIKKALVDNITVSEKVILPLANDATSPTIQFGDGDSGFYEESDDVIAHSSDGVKRFTFRSTDFRSESVNGGGIAFAVTSNTVPSLIPNISDSDTGIGWVAANAFSVIVGGVELVRFSSLDSTFIGTVGLTPGNDFKIGGISVLNATTLGASVLASSLTSVGILTSVNTSGAYSVGGTQVVTSRGAAVADAVGGAVIDGEARTAINSLLARVRAHGLIA